MREKSICLSWNDFVFWRPLHSDNQWRLWNVLLNNGPRLHVVLKTGESGYCQRHFLWAEVLFPYLNICQTILILKDRFLLQQHKRLVAGRWGEHAEEMATFSKSYRTYTKHLPLYNIKHCMSVFSQPISFSPFIPFILYSLTTNWRFCIRVCLYGF